MKNIHVFPTSQPSNIWINYVVQRLIYGKFTSNDAKINCQNQSIYITSDEEIKEGDWCLDEDGLKKCTAHAGAMNHYFQKIILTTDQYLIKDGVQAIPDEFLEWFVKNPSCELVEIRYNVGTYNPDYLKFYEVSPPKSYYKIIIPKEEFSKDEIDRFFVNMVCNPKEEPKQETLEEASKKYALNRKFNMTSHLIGFRKGAKWQAERMYSEEEVHKILGSYSANKEVFSHKYTYDMWFEQFKKK